MGGSGTLDIILGLFFLYLVLALTVTAAQELIASLFKLRPKNLLKGLQAILHDPKGEGVVQEVLDHPMIVGVRKDSDKRPSYLSPETYASVLTNLVLEKAPAQSASKDKAKEKEKDGLQRGIDALAGENKLLAKLLTALLQDAVIVAGADGSLLSEWRKRIATHFEDAMGRISGWYKRQTQWIVLLIAALLCCGLNADTISVAQVLARDAGLRSSVAATAQRYVAQPTAVVVNTTQPSTRPATTLPVDGSIAADLGSTQKRLDENLHILADSGLPLGWRLRPERAVDAQCGCRWNPQCVNRQQRAATAGTTGATDEFEPRYFPNSFWGWCMKVIGLAMTVLAVSLGAPFWFDVLSKVSTIRGAGVKPSDQAKAKKA